MFMVGLGGRDCWDQTDAAPPAESWPKKIVPRCSPEFMFGRPNTHFRPELYVGRARGFVFSARCGVPKNSGWRIHGQLWVMHPKPFLHKPSLLRIGTVFRLVSPVFATHSLATSLLSPPPPFPCLMDWPAGDGHRPDGGGGQPADPQPRPAGQCAGGQASAAAPVNLKAARRGFPRGCVSCAVRHCCCTAYLPLYHFVKELSYFPSFSSTGELLTSYRDL